MAGPKKYTTKTEKSVSLEAMMMSCANNAKEGRYVVVIYILSTFLHAYMDQDIHILLEGTILELIMRLEPMLYWKYIWKNKNGKPVL